MESLLKSVSLVILWLVLGWQVVIRVYSNNGDTSYLFTLALLAWLGGLVTNEMFRMVYSYYFNWREKRARRNWDKF